MDNSLYLMGNRMVTLADRLRMTSTNLANASTPGFKRLVGGFSATLQNLLSATFQADGSVAPAPRWVYLSGPKLDMSQGPVHVTGRPLDLAVRGPAFFVLETPQGRRYTRRGRVYLNDGGEFCDAVGNRFLSGSGPLRIPQDTAQITVQSNGEVLADGQSVGRLELVEIPQPETLIPEGWGVLRNAGSSPSRAHDSEVIQGAIEGSNVKAVQEMVALVEIMRAYEMSTRTVKRLDNLQRQLVQKSS